MAIKASIALMLDVGGRLITIAKDSPYRLAEGGLRGVEAADYRLSMENNALTDGGYIASEAFDAREISITFGVADKAHTEAHRRLLLRYLNPKRQVTLTVTRTGVTRKIQGRIDGEIEFEQPNIRENYLYVTVNLLCPDPWFYDPEPVTHEFKKAVPLLTFPFNSLAGVGVMSGLVWRSDELEVDNPGDDAMGILATIKANGAIKNPKLTLDGGDYVRLISTLNSGDTAKISTVPKQKNIWINEASALVYDRQSVFFSVPAGKHTLVLSADSGAENAATSVACYFKYLGV